LFVEQALESPVAEKHQKQQKALDAICKYRKKNRWKTASHWKVKVQHGSRDACGGHQLDTQQLQGKTV